MTISIHAGMSDFGRTIDIVVARYEYRQHEGEWGVVGKAEDGRIVYPPMESLTEGTAVPRTEPTLRLTHEEAQGLFKALYQIYGTASVPSDPALKEALQIERARVDKLINKALSE